MQIYASVIHTVSSVVNLSPLPKASAGKGTLTAALNIVFSVIGAISLLIVVIAGFRYIMSEGDPQAVAQAKGAIIYAAVGLIVSIMAITIVGFVTGNIG